jgi:hypothetical protein
MKLRHMLIRVSTESFDGVLMGAIKSAPPMGSFRHLKTTHQA